MLKSKVSKQDSQLLWKIPSKISFIAVLIFILSCSSVPPKKTEDIRRAIPQVLSGDVYFEQQNHSYKLKSEIYVLGEAAVRVELRTQLDLPLATLVLTDRKVEYILYRDKKYFVGKPGPHALDRIIPIDVTAQELVALLLEAPLSIQKCEEDHSLLVRCSGGAGPMSYVASWGKRNETSPWSGRATKLTVEMPLRKIILKFYFTELQKNLSNVERLSQLSVPPDFHK